MDIDRIKEAETDAAIDAHMADAADQFLEERELLNTLTVQFAEVVELAKKVKGFCNLTHFSTLGPDVGLTHEEFVRLFGNNPDVSEEEKPNYRAIELSVDMNGIKVYCLERVEYKMVRV